MSTFSPFTSGTIYELGDKPRLSVTFTDSITGALADPSTVTLLVQSPDNTQTLYTYLTDISLVRDSIGQYHLDLPLTQAGRDAISPAYLYRWTGTGNVAAVTEGYLIVAPTALVPQPTTPPQWTLADLQSLNAAIVTGARQVHYQDRSVTYSSMSEMLIARNLIYGYLYPSAAGANRMIRLHTGRGV